MRFADVVTMAFSSLWQQRGRTLLTLVGVVIGSLILLFSLAARRGVQQAVVRVFSESEELRRIEIWPEYYPTEDEAPPSEVKPHGEMTPAKRERIRKMLVRQWQQEHARERTGITRERLDELKSLPHVASVVPEVSAYGWAVLGASEQQASFVGVPADGDVLRKRIVAGTPFASDHDEGVLVHEFLAYRWGAITRDELEGLVGRKVRLEIRYRAEAIANMLAYRAGQQMKLSPDEIRALNRAFDSLGSRVEDLPLPDDELDVLKRFFPPPSEADKPPETRVISQEFTIRGVYRGPTEEEERDGIDVSQFHGDAQVFVPIGTATDFYLDRVDSEGYGFLRATVFVDDDSRLGLVSARLRELGYSEHSLIRVVERIDGYVSIVTWSFAAVAGVALFVAAVGITNTMIMSVLERTHEIGVMKSVGARDRHILSIFLTEGALVGVLGAAVSIGVALIMSLGIDWVIRAILEREIHRSFDDQSALAFSWWMFGVVVAVASLVTMLAAVIPARRAARISPVTALRRQ